MCPVRTYEIWPAQHDWLRRYFVFERATYVLEEIVAAGICIYIFQRFTGLNRDCVINCAIGFDGNIDIDIHLLV